MSLFSFFRKNRQDATSGDTAFYSQADSGADSKSVRKRRSQSNTGDPAADPDLPEKKRARRRLIGAIALVLAAIIGLPMVLDSEPKPLADDITVQIPSKDKPSHSHNIHQSALPAVADATSLDAKEEVIDPAPAAQSDTKKTSHPPVVAVVPANGTGIDKSKENKPKETVKKPEPPKAAIIEKPPSHSSVHSNETKVSPSKLTEKPDDSGRAIALLEGKAESKAEAEKKQSSRFVIQVAALATQEKVNELQTKLKDAGIKSYTQKVATEAGERIRIRVGPFSNKDEADKVRAKIIKIGLSGTIVPA